MIELRDDLRGDFEEPGAFEKILALEGETFRKMDGRSTFRWVHRGKGYFVKIHLGVGWKEILKNLLYLRLPVLGAANEWLAIQRLEQLGVDTMSIAGYGVRGWNPARRQSFLITDELEDTVSLEDFCRDWVKSPPAPALKRALIAKVADMARRLHQNGVNHRDFYICHFLLKRTSIEHSPEKPKLHLIDLHRVQLRGRTPRRWILKDLAGLYFSSMDIGLTRNDLLRFLRVYRGVPLRKTLRSERGFWGEVTQKASSLYRRHFDRSPRLWWTAEGRGE